MGIHSTEVAMEIAYYLWKEGIPVNSIAKRCDVHRATVYRWIESFRIFGLERTVARYKKSKRVSKNGLSKATKELIVRVRKRHKHCCGQKLQYYLKRDYGVDVSLSSIYRVLKDRKLVRTRRRRNKVSRPNMKVEWERQLIEVDTVDLGKVYAYTFIDVYTRQAQVIIEESLESQSGKQALMKAMSSYKYAHTIQTDGGSEFKREFRAVVNRYCFEHRYSRPYRKNDQAHIESFNRSLRQECVGRKHYQKEDINILQDKVDRYVEHYNNTRPHLGLNMQTPNQVAICRI